MRGYRKWRYGALILGDRGRRRLALADLRHPVLGGNILRWARLYPFAERLDLLKVARRQLLAQRRHGLAASGRIEPSEAIAHRRVPARPGLDQHCQIVGVGTGVRLRTGVDRGSGAVDRIQDF